MPVLQSFSPDIAVDIGTTFTRIYVKNKGIVVNEPSVMLVRGEKHQKVVAIGNSAEDMIGRSGSQFHVIEPIRNGVIVDYENAQIMISFFVNKAIGSKLVFRPRVVVTCPSNLNKVEQKSVTNAMERIGARQTYVVEQAFAAALGTGLHIYEPQGNLVVDIGAGTTEVALISMGGIVYSESIRVAGLNIDDAISQHLKKRFGLVVTDRTAEQIKFDLTDVRSSENQNKVIVVRGRDVATGMPFTQDVSTSELCQAIHEPLSEIIQVIRRVLEKTPPELCMDILQRGIFLTGGTSLLPGLDAMIVAELGIPVSLAREAGECTIIGAGFLADRFDELSTRSGQIDKK